MSKRHVYATFVGLLCLFGVAADLGISWFNDWSARRGYELEARRRLLLKPCPETVPAAAP